MFERFTAGARYVAIRGQEECRRLGHPEVDSGHLLLALVSRESNPTAAAFVEHGAGPGEVRAEIERRMPRGQTGAERPRRFADDAKRVMERSWRVSLEHRSNVIDPWHLAWCLVEDGDGPDPLPASLQILTTLDVDVPALRDRLDEAMHAPQADQSEPAEVVDGGARLEARQQRARWATLREEVPLLIDDLDRLLVENERLRRLLVRQGIDPDLGTDEGGAAGIGT